MDLEKSDLKSHFKHIYPRIIPIYLGNEDYAMHTYQGDNIVRLTFGFNRKC